MMRFWLWVVISVLLAAVLPARAEHASIELRLMRLDPATGAVKAESSAPADKEPPQGGLNERPLFQVKANEPLVFQFFLTNTYPHGEKKDVVVSYFVVREEKPRQKNVPELKEGVVTKGSFTLNFKPKCRVGSRVAFTIKDPGVYLLRVQTANTDSDHEHFAAIDIDVK